MMQEFCECGRVLQPNSAAESSGLCDHCREVSVLERTPLANLDYRYKTGEYVEEKRERRRIDWKQFLFGPDPESCPCQECEAEREAGPDERYY